MITQKTAGALAKHANPRKLRASMKTAEEEAFKKFAIEQVNKIDKSMNIAQIPYGKK